MPVTVVPLGPVTLNAADQETEAGDEVTVTATVPAPGFVVLRADDGGAPGEIVAVSGLLQLGSNSITFTLDPAITEDTTFWVSVHIDFDGDGEYADREPLGLDDGGEPAERSIVVSVPQPDDEDGDA